MLEIGPRSWTERGLTNCIWIIQSLDQCDWLILSPFKILDQYLASWTLGLKHGFSGKKQSIRSDIRGNICSFDSVIDASKWFFQINTINASTFNKYSPKDSSPFIAHEQSMERAATLSRTLCILAESYFNFFCVTN